MEIFFRSATGIDVAGILQKIPGVQQPPVVKAAPVMPVVQPVQPAFVAPPPTLVSNLKEAKLPENTEII